jgi:formylglycine-generating enzyme required for sulfatase activity
MSTNAQLKHHSLIGQTIPVAFLVIALGVLAYFATRAFTSNAASVDARTSAAPEPPCASLTDGEIWIRGGMLHKGSGAEYREETPETAVAVGDFWIDQHEVTNHQFAGFVAATGYVTEAERSPDPRDYPGVPVDRLLPGGAVFVPPGVNEARGSWWRYVAGANWRHPLGPDTELHGRERFPVVQISLNDALAYAHWMGRDLPTEDEFEYAARGGLERARYAWGDELTPDGQSMANVWQGEFPGQNRSLDGFEGAAPVGCFPPNGYGLYDMIGNVWEWTRSPYSAVASGTPAARAPYTIKGGSFLCAPNYCRRYRPAARQPEDAASSTMHLGFRTVRRTAQAAQPDHFAAPSGG